MGSPSGSSSRVDLARPPPVQYSTIQKDLHFEELSQFKKAVADWAVGAGFNVMTKKSDKYVLLPTINYGIERSQNSHGDRQRAVFVCAVKSCPFRVYASWHKKEKCFIVGPVEDKHTCVGVGPIPRRVTASTQRWLLRVLPTVMVVNKSTKPEAIIEAIGLKFRVSTANQTL